MSEQSLSLIGRDPSNRKVIRIRDVKIGGHEFVAMAGPCSVESHRQIMMTARAVKAAGARILRGGAFKPRTSPYDFQGLGIEALELLAEASEATGLPVITEVMDTEDIPLVCQFADILQVGARNMQNFALLKKLGRVSKPVLLKRGFCATIREFLLAAEYIAANGNPDIILCERGIRTFDKATRNTLDISAVPVLNEETSLPVIVDPSHAAGRRSLVPALAKAAVAAGADGLLIEVHPNPAAALSDGPQSLDFPMFTTLMGRLKAFVELEGRVLRSSSDGSESGLTNNEPELDLVPA